MGLSAEIVIRAKLQLLSASLSLAMVKVLIFLLPLAWAASPGPRDPLHASCSVKWTLLESCASAQQKIVDQMNLWDNEDCETKPDDDKPHGQKCLYHHTGTEGWSQQGRTQPQSTVTLTTSHSPLSRAAIQLALLMPTPYLRPCPSWTLARTTATCTT